MAYTAWSVVYGEQPTAAKWNQLGANDAGFKDGTNIDAGAITEAKIAASAVTSAKLNVIPTTDANGWKVYSFGTTKLYKKRVTFSNTVAGLVVFPISSNNLPVGVSTIGNATYINATVTADGNAGALVAVPELTAASTLWNFTASSTDGLSRTYSGFIDLEMLTL